MAKFLSFKRATSEVVTIDSVQGTVDALGTALGAAETSSAFPGRSQNLAATYIGNSYMLYQDTVGAVQLAKYDGAAWPNHGPFTPLSTGVGEVYPLGLTSIGGYMLAVGSFANTGGSDRITVARSAGSSDASFSSASFTFPTQPTVTSGGHIAAWRSALFIATSAGILFYDPATETFAATLDTGSDSDITGNKATFGCFAIYQDDLYFILPTTSAVQTPKLYKLNSAWSLASPSAVPAWEKVTVAIPSAGALFVGADTGPYTLFTNKAGYLTAWFSGNDGTKVIQFEATTSGLISTDITTTVLDLDTRSIVNAGWAMVTDDRRRLNEQQLILCRNIAASPQSVLLLSWDGAGQAELVASLTSLDLMLPNEEYGDFRIFTDTQPSAFITSYTQPFPGRMEIVYTLRDSMSRPVTINGEYSLDKQTWLPMTQGSGDDGATDLATTPVGSSYTYYWDVWQDLTGSYQHVAIRIVGRISGV